MISRFLVDVVNASLTEETENREGEFGKILSMSVLWY